MARSENVLIAGFIIAGGTSKRLVIRGDRTIAGSIRRGRTRCRTLPSSWLITGAVIATNDDWGNAAAEQELIDRHFAPTSEKESAMIV